MNIPVHFALNHMVSPRLDLRAFLGLASRLGVNAVEIRNDLPGVAIDDGTPAATIRAAATAAGQTIVSINALQRFNDWTDARAAEARRLIAYASESGAAAIVLCPVNDAGFAPPDAERLAMLREALRALRLLLSDAGIVGLVEPLGFAECSLRLKREAVEAIRMVGGDGVFRLVHDTFHHHVAGETEMFPAETGLVHISGVVDKSLGVAGMRDPHRVLVGNGDRIDNVGQIRSLRRGGYAGALSFEPFAASVHAAPDIETDLRNSMNFIATELREAAA